MVTTMARTTPITTTPITTLDGRTITKIMARITRTPTTGTTTTTTRTKEEAIRTRVTMVIKTIIGPTTTMVMATRTMETMDGPTMTTLETMETMRTMAIMVTNTMETTTITRTIIGPITTQTTEVTKAIKEMDGLTTTRTIMAMVTMVMETTEMLLKVIVTMFPLLSLLLLDHLVLLLLLHHLTGRTTVTIRIMVATTTTTLTMLNKGTGQTTIPTIMAIRVAIKGARAMIGQTKTPTTEVTRDTRVMDSRILKIKGAKEMDGLTTMLTRTMEMESATAMPDQTTRITAMLRTMEMVIATEITLLDLLDPSTRIMAKATTMLDLLVPLTLIMVMAKTMETKTTLVRIMPGSNLTREISGIVLQTLAIQMSGKNHLHSLTDGSSPTRIMLGRSLVNPMAGRILVSQMAGSNQVSPMLGSHLRVTMVVRERGNLLIKFMVDLVRLAATELQ